jgi:dethiobiotin synthetase
LKGIFVTGTDTGVGKTTVCAGLLRAIREEGINAAPAKPVQTGCVPGSSGLSAPDLDLCLETAEMTPDAAEKDLMCPFRLLTACSPHLASRIEGKVITVGRAVHHLEQLSNLYDLVIAEGSGGVMVPLNETETMLELMVELNWPVLLVARGSLGTINHTLLSLQTIRSSGLAVTGVVINHLQQGRSIITSDNPHTVRQFGNVEILGELPYGIQDRSDAGRMVFGGIYKKLLSFMEGRSDEWIR